MTKQEIKDYIANNIKYKDWDFHVNIEDHSCYVQIKFTAKDNFTGHEEKQYCRKWQLSPFMTETEIVRTCFLAVIQAERHEIEEQFFYKKCAIFNSHINVNLLTTLCETEDNLYDLRPAPLST